MKINYFKSGSIAYMLLGIMHVLSHIFGGSGHDPQLIKTLEEMKTTTFDLMGEHTLFQFYTGFSLTMGLLLFAFGLQAYMMDHPSKRVIMVTVFISLIALVLAFVYFHLLASAILFIASICFTISWFRQ